MNFLERYASVEPGGGVEAGADLVPDVLELLEVKVAHLLHYL